MWSLDCLTKIPNTNNFSRGEKKETTIIIESSESGLLCTPSTLWGMSLLQPPFFLSFICVGYSL